MCTRSVRNTACISDVGLWSLKIIPSGLGRRQLSLAYLAAYGVADCAPTLGHLPRTAKLILQEVPVAGVKESCRLAHGVSYLRINLLCEVKVLQRVD